MMRRNPPDRHASERERKIRRRRYGMRVTGRSTRLLAQLAGAGRRKNRSR